MVFALTSSTQPDDVAIAYDYRIAGYLHKPDQGHEYTQLRQLLEVYCQVVEFAPPPVGHPPTW